MNSPQGGGKKMDSQWDFARKLFRERKAAIQENLKTIC
jgi:hypothetical protein